MTTSAATTDLELLRRFEPVLRFTGGELFLPTHVDGYVRHAALWTVRNGEHRELVSNNDLSLDSLVNQAHEHRDQPLYLRLVDHPLNGIELQRWRNRPDKVRFRAPSRLARVGITSRLIDAGFDVSLLLRGRVPGGTTAAAQVMYADVLRTDPATVYHGRVLRIGGYTVLHYLFFYFMNDYRSTFFGANDHEADWEQVMIFVEERPDGTVQPLWVAGSCHDFSGDDLRRRWDDPELEKDGDHPILYAGAGSHAHYFHSGEYLTIVELDALRPFRVAAQALVGFWRRTLRQGSGVLSDEDLMNAVSVPFIDYARGDGQQAGPGTEHPWTPVLIDDSTPWVSGYPGLWGLDTRDWFAGERAPAGPRFNRNGSLRQSWIDPLGWAGLDKVPPPGRARETVVLHLAALEKEEKDASAHVDDLRERTRARQLDIASLRDRYDLAPVRTDLVAEESAEIRDLQRLVRRVAEIGEVRTRLMATLKDIESGNWGNPRAHIGRLHVALPVDQRRSRIAELWSSISIALLLLGIVVFFLVAPDLRWPVAIAVIGGFIGVEALLRGGLTTLMVNITVVLAIVASVLVFIQFWPIFLISTILALAIVILRDNIRELRRS